MCLLGIAHDGRSDQEQRHGEGRPTECFSRHVVAIAARGSKQRRVVLLNDLRNADSKSSRSVGAEHLGDERDIARTPS